MVMLTVDEQQQKQFRSWRATGHLQELSQHSLHKAASISWDAHQLMESSKKNTSASESGRFIWITAIFLNFSKQIFQKQSKKYFWTEMI